MANYLDSSLFMGEINIENLFLGDKTVDAMYLGEIQVFSSGPFVGLKLSPRTIEFQKDSGLTANLKVKASETWSLALPNDATWLSASTLTGDTGETTVVLSTVEGMTSGTSRNAVITATTANYSATCEVIQNGFVSDYLFNYNAKEYDATTHSFPKKDGQTFNQDLVLNTGVTSATTDYVVLDGSQWTGVTYNSTNDNIFNRGGSFGKDFTFIYKAKFQGTDYQNVISCRYPSWLYNYFVRYGYSFCGDPALQLEPPTQPAIVVTTVDSDGNGVRSIYGTQLSTSGVCNFGNNSQGFAFFSGYADSDNESFVGDFYWMFMATRKLTDNEIRTVIDYNENL